MRKAPKAQRAAPSSLSLLSNRNQTEPRTLAGTINLLSPDQNDLVWTFSFVGTDNGNQDDDRSLSFAPFSATKSWTWAYLAG